MMRFKTVMKFFGSRPEVVKHLQVSDAALSQWQQMDLIPELRALQIDWITNHKLKYRPRLYGNAHLRKLK